MKKRLFSAVFILLLLLTISLPVMAESTYSNVIDEAGILKDQEISELNEKAAKITEKYNCGIYITIIDDYSTHSDTIRRCAEDYYINQNMGCGEEKDGAMLLLSMSNRKFSFICHGTYGNTIFTDDNRDDVISKFTDDFADDDWYGGLDDYLDEGAFLLKTNGRSHAHLTKSYLIGFVAAAVIALIVCLVFTAQMKTAVKQINATGYIPPNGIKINQRSDIYTHTTTTRRKIETSSSSGGGGGSSGSRSGFSGTDGSF